ncbi:MAG: hypothetical protein HYZ49_16315 [Chloroflexi bacterium]|nr:hypothetical protein [Chloroflexota bacterium]
MTPADYLKEAIRSARAGNRERAILLLEDVLETEPNNAVAWFWLSDVAEDIHAQIMALERALAISPDQPRAMARLTGLYEQREAAVRQRQKTLLAEAEAAKAAGRTHEARELLLQLVDEYENNETAWLMLSEMVDDVSDQIMALENALTVNPQNGWVKNKLATLKRWQNDPLTMGDMFVEQGDLARAESAYLMATVKARTVVGQRDAERRLADLKRLKEIPGFKAINPTLTLARLTVGPSLLYGLMLLTQAGLDPLGASPIFYVAGFGVLIGGFLMASAFATPRHPMWTWWLGPDGVSRFFLRLPIGLTGFFFLIMPFALLLWQAWIRLDVYRASLR